MWPPVSLDELKCKHHRFAVDKHVFHNLSRIDLVSFEAYTVVSDSDSHQSCGLRHKLPQLTKQVLGTESEVRRRIRDG